MKPLLLAFLLVSYSVSNAQSEIEPKNLKQHIGDTVKVHGKISGIIANSGKDNHKPTLIYVGGRYPMQALTVYILPDVKSKLHLVPTVSDIGNIVMVTGRLEKYKGNTRIIIKDPKQLDIIQDMQGEPE